MSYSNQFNLSDDLAHSISSIISSQEESDYLCRQLIVTIPKHKRFNPEYHKYVIIPKSSHSFLVVMDQNSYQKFSTCSFENKGEIERTLDILSAFWLPYDGMFDSRELSERFPYLKTFFDNLDQWRASTGRVTIDYDVLESCIKKVSNRGKQKKIEK